MAVLDRPQGYSLWMSCLLPSDTPSWELMATSDNHHDLEQKQRALKPIAQRRRLAVVAGINPPRWEPKL
jgi:hypothetical protein